MHINSGAPRELWIEACYAATYIINRLARLGEKDSSAEKGSSGEKAEAPIIT
jgi:hypothetical protein